MAMSGKLDEDNDDFGGISDQIRCKVNLIGGRVKGGREGNNIDQSYWAAKLFTQPFNLVICPF